MNQLASALLLVSVLFACSSEKQQTEIPDNIISKHKLARIISHIHIAEARNNLRTLPDSTSTSSISFKKIFEADSVTKEQYEESLTFYIDHPELLNEVYEEVMNELSKMQGAASKQ